MTKRSILNLASLKDQVYDYLRQQMKVGALRPGAVIDMNATSLKLGVSKTPLRDAIIQLDMEGFVSILPRRGVVVNVLTIRNIQDIYQIVGALESTALRAASANISEADVARMRRLNASMENALEKDNFDAYYEHNLKFHDIFLNISGNMMLKRTADILKKRLYDFPRRAGYVREWEESSIKEHRRLVEMIAEGNFQEAANYIRDVHWSFAVQEKFIKAYYAESPEE